MLRKPPCNACRSLRQALAGSSGAMAKNIPIIASIGTGVRNHNLPYSAKAIEREEGVLRSAA
jgi:hypothetical protein